MFNWPNYFSFCLWAQLTLIVSIFILTLADQMLSNPIFEKKEKNITLDEKIYIFETHTHIYIST